MSNATAEIPAGSAGRDRMIWRTIYLSVPLRACSAVASLWIPRVLFSAGGAELAGSFSLILTLLQGYGSADLGIGNSLIQKLAASRAAEHAVAERRALVSNALASFLILAAVSFLVLRAATFSQPAVTVAALAILALTIPASLGQKIITADSRVLLAHAVNASAAIAGAWLIWLQFSGRASMCGMTSTCSAYLYLLPPLVLNAVCSLWVIGTSAEYLPAFRFVERTVALDLVRSGLWLSAMQGLSAFLTGADIILLKFAGQHQAAGQVALLARPIAVTAVLSGLILAPLYPAFSHAIAKGDSQWAIRAFHRYLGLTVACAAGASAFIWLFRAPLFSLWLGPEFVPDATLLWLVAANALCLHVFGYCSVVLNSGARFHWQTAVCVVICVCHALFRLPLSGNLTVMLFAGLLLNSALAVAMWLRVRSVLAGHAA